MLKKANPQKYQKSDYKHQSYQRHQNLLHFLLLNFLTSQFLTISHKKSPALSRAFFMGDSGLLPVAIELLDAVFDLLVANEN